MWNRRLAARATRYTTGVLSVEGEDDYPLSVRCAPRLDAKRRVFTFASLPPLAADWRGPACLLFHAHDERLEELRQLVVRGELVEEGEGPILRVESFVTAYGRTNTDAMPHASAPLHMLQFYWLGRRKARAYLAKRGAPWPPISYAEIDRAIAEDTAKPQEIGTGG
jgi:hypothetical protein